MQMKFNLKKNVFLDIIICVKKHVYLAILIYIRYVEENFERIIKNTVC